MSWEVNITTEKGTEKLISSDRKEIKDFFETHHGEKYTICKTLTGVVYESGIVDATSGEDLEYRKYNA